MMKYKYVDGCAVKVQPVLSTQKFPLSEVEPDSAYTIRKIYDNWTKGKPTSPHVFDCEYDEETSWGTYDQSEHSDDFAENPIDRTQVLNDIADAREQFDQESVAVAKEKKRRAMAAAAQKKQQQQLPPPKSEDSPKE